MEDQLWNLFRETGDPMGYLLYRAEKRRKATKTGRKTAKPGPPAGRPPASG